MTTTRVYLVDTSFDDNTARPPRLVRAGNRAQAERHVARSCITAHVATQDELIAHLSSGIETAGADDDAEGETT